MRPSKVLLDLYYGRVVQCCGVKETAKTRRLQVRMTPEFYALLRKFAAASGLGLSDFAREVLFESMMQREKLRKAIVKVVKEAV